MTWVAANTRKKQSGATVSGWSRPSDWPALPTINNGDQKFVGLHAVFNSDSNFVALSATGAYTVDWGDGTATENYASGVQANHKYDYASVAGNVTSRGYKTCIVTVMPQSGNLTGLNLSKKHTQAGVSNYSTGWLEIAISGLFTPTGLVIGAASTVTLRYLERVVCLFGTESVTSMYNMFANCSSLQSVPLFNTAAVTTMGSMFYNCSSLQSVPLFNTAAVTTMASMFASCSSLAKCSMNNVKTEVSYSGCLLSREAIVEIFNNLVAVSALAITVSNNWGYSSLTANDLLIATGKGWVVN